MQGSKRSGPSAPRRTSLYDSITARIVAQLEAGCLPWVQPWTSAPGGVGMPRNAATGRVYSGINILSLWDAIVRRGFSGHGFLTFRQALALGGHVRRGERGIAIVYAHRFVPGRERAEAAAEGRAPGGSIPFLRQFMVFSTDQCDGLPTHVGVPPVRVADELIQPQAQRLIDATGAHFRIGGPSAYYCPVSDHVQVPCPRDFQDPVDWHRTAFHELGHWTGHRLRLDRDQSGRFGSPAYAREELVAEMTGAFVCAALGIVPKVRHADYIGAWLELVSGDSRAIVRAASAASKAADLLLGFQPELDRASAVALPVAGETRPSPAADRGPEI